VFETLRRDLGQLLKETIRPEFLNRVDEVIVFKPLTVNDIRQVVSLQLTRVQALIQGRGIQLEIPDDVRDRLASLGYDPVYGARPLKRVIQKHVVNPLSSRLLLGELKEGDAIVAELGKKGEIVFRKLGDPQAVR